MEIFYRGKTGIINERNILLIRNQQQQQQKPWNRRFKKPYFTTYLSIWASVLVREHDSRTGWQKSWTVHFSLSFLECQQSNLLKVLNYEIFREIFGNWILLVTGGAWKESGIGVTAHAPGAQHWWMCGQSKSGSREILTCRQTTTQIS